MNCLETRRSLLAEPRRRTHDLERHLETCAGCSSVASGLTALDDRIADAASLPVPDALAERILLARKPRPKLRYYAAAAAIVLAASLGTILGTSDLIDPATTVEAVGPEHPAVAAISEVAQDVPRAALSDVEASREMEQVLGRLGLALKKGEATAHYVGKCQVTGALCDLIVLSTHDAQANVLLVPDHPLGERVLVSDGRMSALVSPARSGGYIVVSDTPKNARRMARLIVKG